MRHKAAGLIDLGLGDSELARRLGVNRSTARYWRAHPLGTEARCPMPAMLAADEDSGDRRSLPRHRARRMHAAGRRLSKHERRIILEPWQQDLVDAASWALLRGLIRSDGCVFINRTGP